MDDFGFLVPVVFLLSLAGFFCLRLRYRHLYRLAAQETIRGAIERGQPLTPELVAQLTGLDPSHGDLRRGVISIAIAIAMGRLCGCGWRRRCAWTVDRNRRVSVPHRRRVSRLAPPLGNA